jgi:nucleoside-diphosphate-sugar epimerase
MIRAHPDMRIASLRFHAIIPEPNSVTDIWRSEAVDLWGWTSEDDAAKAILLALTVDEERFPNGHERILIVAAVTGMEEETMELMEKHYPDVLGKREFKGNEGLFDCSKAERLLWWKSRAKLNSDWMACMRDR